MNKTQQMTREITFAAILTALSIIITQSPFKLIIPPYFTLTYGCHVPTFIAMFISPWVAVMSIIGSVIGFLISSVPNPVLVAIRAALHLSFAIVGVKMIQKKFNIFLVILITAVLHALAEGIAVYLLTPILAVDSKDAPIVAGCIAASGTFIHHLLDTAIATPILLALSKAKLVNKPYFLTKRRTDNYAQ